LRHRAPRRRGSDPRGPRDACCGADGLPASGRDRPGGGGQDTVGRSHGRHRVSQRRGLLDAIDAGAIAYLTKTATADEIIEAVRKASVGEVLIPVGLFAKAIARQLKVGNEKEARDKLLAEFTPRELDVLKLLAEGHDTHALAQHLGIAPHTVEWHVTHVIEKLRVHSKLQAVIAAARLGLIEI
jgi:DNA-binding NarL/FixJ family response regulator